VAGINGSSSSQVTSMDVDGGRSAGSGGGTGKAPMQQVFIGTSDGRPNLMGHSCPGWVQPPLHAGSPRARVGLSRPRAAASLEQDGPPPLLVGSQAGRAAVGPSGGAELAASLSGAPSGVADDGPLAAASSFVSYAAHGAADGKELATDHEVSSPSMEAVLEEFLRRHRFLRYCLRWILRQLLFTLHRHLLLPLCLSWKLTLSRRRGVAGGLGLQRKGHR
jgi:hypothetical protein